MTDLSALTALVASLPVDALSAFPLSARYQVLLELIAADRAAGIEPMSPDGLLHDPESLPAELRIAGLMARAVEVYRQARRAA